MIEIQPLYILSAFLGTGIIVLLYIVIQKSKNEQELTLHVNELSQQLQEQISNNTLLEKELLFVEQQLQEHKKENEQLLQEKQQLFEQKSIAIAKLDAFEKANEKLEHEYEERSKQLQLKLNEIMQKSLEQKIEKFDKNSSKTLEEILKPFKEDINTFKKKVEETQEKSIKRFSELSKEIEFLANTTKMVSQEAQNLTEALKGKKQSTGAWGEMILDSVLEYSGLLQGEHYEKQISYRDEDGEIKRPDVVIKLPAQRSIIIDSKVPLSAYEEFIRQESDEQKLICAKQLVQNFKNHIDTLASKDYTHYDIGTLQYVFMFIPIEGAFATALQTDHTLYEYALKKHIAIVTPSTLTVTLRTIYLHWQSEKSSEFAQKMFVEAGKLYDKIVGFSQSFEKIGSQLQTVQKSYDNALKQLANGSGNVLKRASNLKALGAKTTKNLKDTKIEYDDFDEEEAEVILIQNNTKEKNDGN
ncbi:MAG: DNA recombination protein RmuC [Epsilonproteobacteria bacterium]|nr:DNA recombination protein RmuC [Campylobacterota bacterium]